MALLEVGVRELSKRLPKVLSPRTHALIDYGVAGAFFVGAGLMWGKSKRAAIASLACGAAEAAIILLSDYPGGIAKVISFERHGQLDAALSGTIAMVPTVLGFPEQKKSIFFRAQAVGTAITTGLTDFKATGRLHRRRAA